MNRIKKIGIAVLAAVLLSGILLNTESVAAQGYAGRTAGEEAAVLAEKKADKKLTAQEQAELDLMKVSMRPVLTYMGGVISQYYIEDVDAEELVQKTIDQLTLGMTQEEALKLMVSLLDDPYSAYYMPKEFQSVMDSTTGSYSGIGANVQQDRKTKVITILSPFQNGPAAKAGMLAGDQIIAIDGVDVEKMDLDLVVDMMKGKDGTQVKVTVLRGGKEKTLTITRGAVEVETVKSSMLKNSIGYIKITQFEAVTVKQFDKALTKLEKKGMKKLVIDLRNNPGGLVDSVTAILDRILPEGKLLVYTEDKYGNREDEYSESSKYVSVPIAVLVNEGSASASEVFCGAVRDYGIGTLIGTKTFGKGIVQGMLQFTDGSAIKLTTSKYYTPEGDNIHGTGFEPDIKVELDKKLGVLEGIPKSKDNQLLAAKKYLRDK